MSTTIDFDSVKQFEKIATEWWNPRGPFRPLHRINPIRIQYIYDTCHRLLNRPADQRLSGLDILDVGCGGGLVSESLARLNANVTAIDAGYDAIETARAHAFQEQLAIDYRCGEISMLSPYECQYDVIVALEIVEHVANVASFIESISKLLKPGGILILSTLNRTIKSYLLGIVAAEYILRWVPRGTHQWEKFLKPSELAAFIRPTNLQLREMTGLIFNPLIQQWKLSSDIDVNYFMTLQQSPII